MGCVVRPVIPVEVNSMKRLIIVWGILIAANTAASYLNENIDLSHIMLVSTIIALTFVKVRLIGIEFMELRTAPLLSRLAYEAWVIALGLALIIMLGVRPI